MMSVRFGILFRCVEEWVYVAGFKNLASLESPALADCRFLNVVSVNSNALDAAIACNCQTHLHFVQIPSRSADRGITWDIRRCRQPHLWPILRLKVGKRTQSGYALINNRALGPIRPFEPAGILVWPVLDIERDISIKRIDEDVARIKSLQSERKLEVVRASLNQPPNLLLRIGQI